MLGSGRRLKKRKFVGYWELIFASSCRFDGPAGPQAERFSVNNPSRIHETCGPPSPSCFFALVSSSFLSTESLDAGDDDVKTPGGSARFMVRSATVTSDNLYLEDKATEGHVFDPSQFERLYLIGKGDVGRVYLCRTKAGGKLCAMKVLDQVCFALRLAE